MVDSNKTKKTESAKKMEPAKVLSFNHAKYPAVLDTANTLSGLTDRNPHNAVNQVMKAIQAHTQDFLKFCRDRGAVI